MRKDKIKGAGYSFKYLSVLTVILLSGSVLFWISVHCGINRTYDSAEYIKSAINGTTAIPSPDNPWPPLFSSILALFHYKLHRSFETMQYIFMVINFLLLWVIGEKTIRNLWLRLAWLTASFLGVSFLMVHVFLWSEPLFMVLFFSMIILFDFYMKKYRLNWLLLMIIFSNLLCLQRNAGIFFVAGFALSLAWFTTGRKRILVPVIYLVTGSIGFIAWNMWIPGFNTGVNLLSDQNFFSGFFFNLGSYLNTISVWFLPRQFSSYLRIALLISGLIVITAGKPLSRIYKDPETLIFITVIIYFTGVSILGRIDEYESERYLAVIYPVAILTVFKRISSFTGRIKFNTRIFIMIIMFLWLSYITARTVINAERWGKAACSANAVQRP